MLLATGMIVDAFHFPSCQSRNRKKWTPVQCMDGMVQSCWSVNVKTGERLSDSARN